MKRKPGGGGGGEDGGEEGSAAPSPRVSGGRLGAGPGGREKGRGSSAQPSTREVSVKIEDGAESVASSVEGTIYQLLQQTEDETNPVCL